MFLYFSWSGGVEQSQGIKYFAGLSLLENKSFFRFEYLFVPLEKMTQDIIATINLIGTYDY